MQGRQVLLVFVLLATIGVVGLVGRFVSAGSDELSLEGLLPIAPEIVDRVTLTGGGEQTTIRRVGDEWRLVTEAAFDRRVIVFWNTVSLVHGAPLVARNPDNHSRMGVDDEQGVRVAFYLGDALQEELIFSPLWSEEVQLCYLRKPRGDEVYGIPCGYPLIFHPAPDSWRDPIIAQFPRDDVESLSFTYPDDDFVLRRAGLGWVVEADGERLAANPLQIETMLQLVGFIIAQGFVSDDAVESIDFSSPDAELTVATVPGSDLGGVSLVFLRASEGSYYVKRADADTVFLVDGPTVDSLLRPRDGYVFTTGTGGG